MGLTDTGMPWRLAVRVIVNGTDVTSVISGSLRSLTVTDTAGIQSDMVEMTLAGEVLLQTVAIPATGAEMQIALGYGLHPKMIGLYVVEETAISSGAGGDTIAIRGYAASYGDSDQGRSGINTQKTRSWPEGTKVSAMMQKIAKEAGFKASVTTESGKIELPHLDQIDESDMALLTRVARENGLIFKAGGGTLAVRTTGESVTSSGIALPSIILMRAEVSSWNMTIRRPDTARSFSAHYRDKATAKTVPVSVSTMVDTQEPAQTSTATSVDQAEASAAKLLSGVSTTKSMVHCAPTKAAAISRAKAKAADLYRKSQQVSVTLPGRADLTAEGRLILSGFRREVDREWLIASVTHQLDVGGWRTTVQAELPPK